MREFAGTMVLALVLAGVGAWGRTAAQNPIPSLPPGAAPPVLTSPQLSIDPKLLHEQERKRRELEQKQLRQDAAQLLALAQQLKTSVDRSDKNILSLDVIDTANRVEKLAKKIKDSMLTGR
ncbi:MAG TPA: hypothetical protein VE996_10435 [Terriglobales bacterium]|nr:hypothetical protein [Terriglobales bacterium]